VLSPGITATIKKQPERGECVNRKNKDQKINQKRGRGRPTERRYPERIDASPEKIAEMVLRMPPKKRGEWRYEKE